MLVLVLQVVLPVLKDIEAKQSKAALGDFSSAITSTTLEYVAALCSTLIRVKNFDLPDWQKVRGALGCCCCCNLGCLLMQHSSRTNGLPDLLSVQSVCFLVHSGLIISAERMNIGTDDHATLGCRVGLLAGLHHAMNMWRDKMWTRPFVSWCCRSAWCPT